MRRVVWIVIGPDTEYVHRKPKSCVLALGLFGLLVTSPAASPEAVQYPNSIAVLAHSGATGYDSDPRRPRVDVRANSWATGTNPAVNSLYRRILARNPRIKGHNINLAENGATVRELLEQSRRAVALKPKPDLLVIQIIDNDLVCPATNRDIANFRAGMSRALRLLTRRSPRSRIFVVSQFGSPETYAKALRPEERLRIGGTGPCDFVDPAGKIVESRLARLEGIIQRYEAQLAATCKVFGRCRYDGGAFGRIVDERAYFTQDLNHLSTSGHAKAAAVAWEALRRVRLIP
jgi:GDSL-like Lipase/Acylhydrolase family